MRVLFAEYLTWNSPFRVGSHYYARHFLELGWQVGWLGGEFHLQNLLGNRTELARKLPIWRQRGIQHADGLWEYTCLKLAPYRNWGPLASEALAWNGYRLTYPSVRRVLGRNGFDQADLLWLTNPQAYPWLINAPAYSRIIYRVADDQTLRPGAPPSIAHVEERIAARADAVLVVHPTMLDRFRATAAERVHLLPNGVDPARFAEQQPRPPEYPAPGHPVAVYVGAILHYFDAALLAQVAQERPGLQFYLIGEATIPLSELAALPNVHLLGPRPPEEIPAYLQHAQVGLLPFTRSPVANVISLKMYEYLACGLPMIHSGLSPETAGDMPVLLAATPDAFCRALDRALATSDAERARYRAYVQAHTWAARFQVVDRLLEDMGLLAR